MTSDQEGFSLTSEMESILGELESITHSRRTEIETTETKYMELALKQTLLVAQGAADRCAHAVEAGQVRGERLLEGIEERGIESFRQAIVGAFVTIIRSAPSYEGAEPTPLFMRRLIEVVEDVRSFVDLYVEFRGLDDEFIPWLGQYSRAKGWSASLPNSNTLLGPTEMLVRQLGPSRYGVDAEFLFAPPAEVEPRSSFALIARTENSGSWVTTFEWSGGRHANYLARIVPGKSIFEDPPVSGFVAFHPEIGVLIALQDVSDALVQACAHYPAEKLYGTKHPHHDPPDDVESWQRLANLVVEATYDPDTEVWSAY